MKGISVSIVFLCLIFNLSHATTYHVSINGNDISGDGSAAKPWRTLRHAVSKVGANQGHIIKLSAGTFVENGPVTVPSGVSIEGAGREATIIRSANSFYFNPANPSYALDKFLINLASTSPSVGNQSLKNFMIDGDSKKLHGGILVRNRNNVTVEGVKVQYTNFTGIWFWGVKDSRINNVQLLNCSWGSTGWCSGALNLAELERVDVNNLHLDEGIGYGIKAIGPSAVNPISNLTIRNSHITVHPVGLWNNGGAPNIALELWNVSLQGCEIYNCYIDNTISLVSDNPVPVTGKQAIRVHNNVIDLEKRSKGTGYAIELTMHDAEIDHNYVIKGKYGIANWGPGKENWKIHHNIFYGIQGVYPGEVVRAQQGGLLNVQFYNNTIEFDGNKTASVIGLYGGTSKNLDMKNNLVINSNTSYSYYPNKLIHTENGASINNLRVTNNLLYKLPVGNISGTYENNLTTDPKIKRTGARPADYYMPEAGSPLIDAGTSIGMHYKGGAPDIGAYEYETSVPPVNKAPNINITSPANNASVSSGATVSITANASDVDGTIKKVEFYSGTNRLGEDATSPYTFNWNNVATGSYTLTAKAIDDKGAATTSSPVTIRVTAQANADRPPVVKITSPRNNSMITAGWYTILTAEASDADGNISRVEFFNGNTKLGEDAVPPYTFIWNKVESGTYTIFAKAIDNSGNVTTSKSITITANRYAAVWFTSPVHKATLEARSAVTCTANAVDYDGHVVKVEFFAGPAKLGEDYTSPYSFVWNNIQPGNYYLHAKATDNLGRVATSVSAFVVADKAGSASKTSPANDLSITLPESSVTIAASSNDKGNSVNYLWTQVSGPADAVIESPTSQSSVVTNLSEGIYLFRAKVTRNKDLERIEEIVVRVHSLSSLQAPLPRFFSPNDDGINDYWEWPDVELYANCTLTVFNRFGEKVYESPSYNNTWDGKINGQPLQADAYYYVIQGGKHNISGAVRILR